MSYTPPGPPPGGGFPPPPGGGFPPPPGGTPPPQVPPPTWGQQGAPPPKGGGGKGAMIAIGVVIVLLLVALVAVVLIKSSDSSDNADPTTTATTATTLAPTTATTEAPTTATTETTEPETTETTEPDTTETTVDDSETCTTCTTDAESFLFRHIDAIHEDSCKIVEPDHLSTARWDCEIDYHGTAIVAEYYKFDAFADLQSLVKQIRAGERTILSEEDFTIDGIRIGTYIFSEDEDENVVWTYDSNKVLGFAYSPGGTYDQLDSWWKNEGSGFTN